MKCLSVYTKDFSAFSDIFETVIHTTFSENEEKLVEGIVVTESGDAPDHYLERMKDKRDVVVMKDKHKDITILQHGNVFEIFLPEQQSVVH